MSLTPSHQTHYSAEHHGACCCTNRSPTAFAGYVASLLGGLCIGMLLVGFGALVFVVGRQSNRPAPVAVDMPVATTVAALTTTTAVPTTAAQAATSTIPAVTSTTLGPPIPATTIGPRVPATRRRVVPTKPRVRKTATTSRVRTATVIPHTHLQTDIVTSTTAVATTQLQPTSTVSRCHTVVIEVSVEVCDLA